MRHNEGVKPLIANRALIGQAPRLVIKIGSSSLTAKDGSLNVEQLGAIVDVVAAARKRGQTVVLVSSGAVAAGIAPLGFTSRPKDVKDQQAAAMVGQQRLMAAYSEAFDRHGITIGQTLLTVEDLVDRKHYANAQGALKRLLHLGVVPIVNENDAVVTDELRFGDNDRVAALVAHLVDASVLILCTDVDGLYTGPPGRGDAVLIPEISSPAQLKGLLITGKGSDVGTGGMRTKVDAADIATSGGVGVLLTSTENLGAALEGEDVGTWFVPRGRRVSARTMWLRYAAMVRGKITVDDGAAHALRSGGASLLAVGVTAVEGSFAAGDLVEIVDLSGALIGRGLSAFSDAEIVEFIPSPAPDGGAKAKLRRRAPRPIVHADDLVQTTGPAVS